MTDWTTLLVPEYIVWVNSNGDVVSTETRSGSATPAIPAPVVDSSSSSIAVALLTKTLSLSSPSIPLVTSDTASAAARLASNTALPAEVEPTTTPAPILTESASSAPQLIATTTSISSLAAPSLGNEQSGGEAIYGLAYDILKGNYPGECKTPDEVSAEMAYFKSKTFTHIRIYDVDCNQVNMVTTAAAANGLKVIVSISNLATLSSSLPQLLSEAGSNLDTIDTIAIGNEYVNGGGAVSDVLSALGYARSYLANAGFTGSIVTIDTCNAISANPTLCDNSDYVAANCHAFFDSDITSSGAGAWVAGQASGLAKTCGDKHVVITESGWPWQGQTNGNAKPSVSDQQAALNSLNAAFPNGGIVLFQAFDTPYKEPGAFGAEPYWGISYLTGGQAS